MGALSVGVSRGLGLGFRTGYGLTVHDAVSRASNVIFRKLYPCLGHRAASVKLIVNFGASDFAWQGAKKLVQPIDSLSMRPPVPRRRLSTAHSLLENNRSRQSTRRESSMWEQSSPERADSPAMGDRDRTRRRGAVMFQEPPPINPRDDSELEYEDISHQITLRRAQSRTREMSRT
ncbi:hypothetical protein ASPZODRAFT_1668009 [Penicilliopsis zonata CBS 506.65]|uniref:Uncharacterized protein n=1 Tax=Penicilliopsis zonata CBS 506.65 TaxID=1073090 RepID=A0A1L9S4N0_9EURO|nr:hypothetical protein ASPZODRAFT_1668009 [Penicilliopsis zonata CBS 506.65]OJJ42104.1 hypothetical protein ASPZODRAFT_1668009 [Penicilliopsis zonata CBS 506.65]